MAVDYNTDSGNPSLLRGAVRGTEVYSSQRSVTPST